MANANIERAKILIVDDEKANVRLLELMLNQAEFINVYSTTDSTEALKIVRNVHPDLLLLDINMPGLDGFDVMRQLRHEGHDRHMPILVLTADSTRETKHKALKEGARDFVCKPLDQVEVLLRIRNLLLAHFHSSLLEQEVQKRTKELENAQYETIHRLALAAEYRDDETGHHTRRVGMTSALIAQALGLRSRQVELIRRAAPLHDVGKIGIPDGILLKPGPLSPQEFEKMKQHTAIGAKLLSGSSSPLLKLAEEIALTHHERWDGTGYAGLREDEIPLSGRIVAVADVFDALLHFRPYKKAWSMDDSLAEIAAQSGRQFDSYVVRAFFSIPRKELEEIQNDVSIDEDQAFIELPIALTSL